MMLLYPFVGLEAVVDEAEDVTPKHGIGARMLLPQGIHAVLADRIETNLRVGTDEMIIAVECISNLLDLVGRTKAHGSQDANNVSCLRVRPRPVQSQLTQLYFSDYQKGPIRDDDVRIGHRLQLSTL